MVQPLGQLLADARLIRLDGAGHFTPLERPEDFAAAATAAAVPSRHP